MAFSPLRLQVITVEDVLLKVAGLRWVKAELADGMAISIWPGHAPLVAQTVSGPMVYADARGEHAVMLQGGILHVEDGEVTIYTTAAPVSVVNGMVGGSEGESEQA